MILSDTQLSEFQKYLDDKELKLLKVMTMALAIGLLIYFIVAIFIGKVIHNIPQTPNDLNFIKILSGINFFISFSVLCLSLFMKKIVFSPKKLNQPINSQEEGAQLSLKLLKTFYLVRLFLFEGSAFFGITVCLIGFLFGVIQTERIFIANIFSSLLFFNYVSKKFPLRRSWEKSFRMYISENT